MRGGSVGKFPKKNRTQLDNAKEILEEGNLSDDSLNEQSQAMIKQSVETDEICDDNEDVSVTFRKELANLPLSQVRKLKEQIGLKLFNKAYFGTTKQNKNSEGDNNDKIVEQHVKRKGQHRPKEISSKTHVSTFRNIYPKDKSEKRRWDPRFDCRTGDYKEHCFEDNYSFLEELRSNEKNELKMELKQSKEDGNISRAHKIEEAIRRMENQEKTRCEKKIKRDTLQEIRQENIDRMMRGERPKFKTKAQVRMKEMEKKYAQLKQENKLDKYLQRRARKESIKTMKRRPSAVDFKDRYAYS